MRAKAILFDLDGTLVESEHLQAWAIANVFAQSQLELGQEDRAFVIGHAWQEIHQQLRVQEKLGLSLSEFAIAALAQRDALEAAGHRTRVIEGASELVARCASWGIPCAIVSGSSRQEIAAAIEQLQIAEHLQFYLGAEDYAAGKPAPDCYLLAASRAAVDPADVLVIEDSEVGIRAGLSAGMKVIATHAAVPFAANSRIESLAVHARIHRLGEINAELVARLFDC